MNKSLRENQYGAVAMITVIFIAILLTIIATGFIRLAMNEQRESTDDDLTTRAFYAAESGVQDAIRAIKTGHIDASTPENQECTPAYGAGSGILSDDDGLSTEYTCQLINMTPDDYRAYIHENDSVFFSLKGSEEIASFDLRWHIYGPKGPDSDGESATARASNDLPPMGTTEPPSPPAPTRWDDHPAMIRLQVIGVPREGANRGNIDNDIGFLNPASGSASRSLAALDVPAAPGVLDASCVYTGPSAGEYFCEIEIDDLKTSLADLPKDRYDYYLHITALYAATHIEVVGIGAVTGNPVALEDAQAVIDVTGKASDVYRRVEERVDLVQSGLWVDYAILSAESICKDFVITDVAVPDYANNNSPDVNFSRSCSF